MKRFVAGLMALACFAQAETIDVPCGQTRAVDAGCKFAGGVLVKTGGGTLDLTGAILANGGLEIREGAVRLTAGMARTATGRFLKFAVTKTRPGAQYSGSGPQYSEFWLLKDGRRVPFPVGTKVIAGNVGAVEGPDKAIDGNLSTKHYSDTPLTLDFGTAVSFDAYSFATANDALGRDPMDWSLSVGELKDGQVVWQVVGSFAGYSAPAARNKEVGENFPVALRDVVPGGYPVTVCGKGRLVLSGASETLENVSGGGLIVLENSSVAISRNAAFTGSVTGGDVSYR